MKFIIFGILAVLLLLLLILHVQGVTADELYSELGLRRGATEQQVKKAFKKLSKEWHPDVSEHDKPVAKERYAKILRAYGVLSDNEKRRMYDIHGVVEGENGVPSSEERKRRGGGGFPFSGAGSPFEFFFHSGGGAGPGAHGYNSRGEPQRIPFRTPELTADLFSQMKLFRGPRLFVVFAYADYSVESRLFASAWERVAVSHGGAMRSIASFYRVNVGTDEYVMQLAGVEPQELPLIFVVRDGRVSVVEDDAVQLMPQDPAGMADVLSMFLMDYLNDLMKDVSGSGAKAAAVLTSAADGEAFLSKKRFHTVLLVDQSIPNAIPCAAAVRSAFADVVIAFVDHGDQILSSKQHCGTKKLRAGGAAWMYRSSGSSGAGSYNKNTAARRLCSPDLRVQHSSIFTHTSLVKSVTSFFRLKHPKDDDAEAPLLRPSAVLQHGAPYRLLTHATAKQFVLAEASSSSSHPTATVIQLVSGQSTPIRQPLVSSVLADFDVTHTTSFAELSRAIVDLDAEPALESAVKQKSPQTLSETLASETHVAALVVTSKAICLIERAVAAADGRLTAAVQHLLDKQDKPCDGANVVAIAVFSESDASQWFEERLQRDAYPPEAWYTPIVRWGFWALRRSPAGALLLLAGQFVVVKILKPLLARRGAGGAGGAGGDNDARDVPSAAGGARVFGLMPFSDAEVKQRSNTTLWIVAIALNAKSLSKDLQTKPPAELAGDISTLRGIPEVQLRSLTSTGTEGAALFRAVAAPCQQQQQNGGFALVAMRGGGGGGGGGSKKCRAAVLAAGRGVVPFAEKLLDGSEPMPIHFSP